MARRFPFVITIAPKEGFMKDGSLDKDRVSKVKLSPGEYLNVWNICVDKVVALPKQHIESQQNFAHERLHEFTDVYSFFLVV